MKRTRQVRHDILLTPSSAESYVADFYEHLIDETLDPRLTDSDRQRLADPILYYGRFLDPKTRNYFRATVVPAIASAAYCLQSNGAKTVLDLGCGLGMQSIIFSSLGMRVLGVDIREESIDLCRRRKTHYEESLGRSLDVQFRCADFLQMPKGETFENFDSVFSMSAFSYIQPLEKTVEKIARLTTPDSRVFLYEENSENVYARIARRRDVPTPTQVAHCFADFGFTVQDRRGVCALPKQLWRYTALNIPLLWIDKILRISPWLQFSYILQLERRDAL